MDTEQGTSGFDCIPDPVICHIFRYLNLKELCQARAVCKRWNILADTPSLWRVVNADRYTLRIGAIQVLVRTCVKSSSVKLLLRAKEATRRSRLNTLTNEILDDIFTRAPTMREIGFQKIDMIFCSSDHLIPSISRLTVRFCNWVPNWLQKAIGRLPQLEYLNLSLSIEVQNSDLYDISQFPSLKELHVSNCFQITDDGIKSLCKTLNQLRVLDISCTQCTNDTLKYIGQSLPSLEILDISSTLFDEEGVREFVKVKTSLKKIALYNVYVSPNAPDLFTRRVWN